MSKNRKNRTNRQRAARTLASRSDLTYAAALELLRSVDVVPDLDDPVAVAALLAARRRTDEPGAAPVLLEGRFEVTIDDHVGHSRDVLDAVELWPDMVAAVAAEPEAVSWTGTTEGSAWTVRPEWVATLDGPGVTWVDGDGNFELAGGGFGNPGCDDCGTEDAVVRVDGRYLCRSAAAELAGAATFGRDDGPHCRFCHRPAGGDHHLAGAVPEGENPVVCDGCWDERLR